MKRWLKWVVTSCAVILAVSGAAVPSSADTFISFTDTDSTSSLWYWFSSAPSTDTYVHAASWTQNVGTSNTTIGAIVSLYDPFTNHTQTTGQGQAYLMKSLGPGTTNASEIASVPFTPPNYTGNMDLTSAPVTTLFTNLTLDPGTYYLVLTETTPSIF